MTEVVFLTLIAVLILSITTLFIADSARIVLIFLGVLYLCSFFLVLQVWPLGLAAVHLLTGLLTVLIINAFCSRLTLQSNPARIALDILMVVFVGVITFAFAPQLTSYFTESSQYLIIGFFLFIIGLLQAGTAQDSFRVFVSLFVFALGFQVIYAPLEGSALVTVLIAFAQIILALVGSQMVIKNREENQ